MYIICNIYYRVRQIKSPSFERLLGKVNNTYRIICCFIRISIQCRLCDHFLKMASGRWWPSVRTFIENERSVVATQRAFRVAPRSPDLSICDFFLWGYLKEKVFRSRPHNLEELKMRIREEIAAIPLEMCRRAAENFRHRLQQCIATDGHHLPDDIFKR